MLIEVGGVMSFPLLRCRSSRPIHPSHHCQLLWLLLYCVCQWQWLRMRERGNPFIKKSVFKTPNKHRNTAEQKRLSSLSLSLSLSLSMRLSKKPTWILMKPLRDCSTKVCFLFQFFCVFGFVLVSGFLFVLLILGLEGCGLCLLLFVHIAMFLVGF